MASPKTAGYRRQKTEMGYEKLIVNMARRIVDSNTTPEERDKARDSLLNSCAQVSQFHALDAASLYHGAIRRAIKEREDD